MSIKITPVITEEDEEAAIYVKRQVFCVEMGIPIGKLILPEHSKALQLLARDEFSGDPIASLTMLETTGNEAVRNKYRLELEREARSVRYSQLSVLKPYRGLKISLRLLLEGHRLFVAPWQFDYSWLLFNARRASSSLLCRLLRFTPSAITVASEMGRSRILIRNERSPECKEAIRQAEAFLHNEVPGTMRGWKSQDKAELLD